MLPSSVVRRRFFPLFFPLKENHQRQQLTNDLRHDHREEQEDGDPHLARLDRRRLGHVVDQRERAVVGVRPREAAAGVEQQHVPGLEAHVADVRRQRHPGAGDADDDGVVARAEPGLADRPAHDRRVGGDGGLHEAALQNVDAELLDLVSLRLVEPGQADEVRDGLEPAREPADVASVEHDGGRGRVLLGRGRARRRRRLPVGAEAERAAADGAVDRQKAHAVDPQQAGGGERLPGEAPAVGDAQARHVLALAVGGHGLDVGDLLAEVLVRGGVERGVDGEDEDVAAAQNEVLEEGAGALLGAVAGDGDDLCAKALVQLGLADREADERALKFFFFFF